MESRRRAVQRAARLAVAIAAGQGGGDGRLGIDTGDFLLARKLRSWLRQRPGMPDD